MHLYVLARGQTDWLERWKNDLSAMFLPYEYEKGKPAGRIRVGVRPIQLLEIVYPEKCHDLMLRTIKPYGNPKTPISSSYIPWLARLMKLKPIRKLRKEEQEQPGIYSQYVSLCGVGCKRDAYDKNGIELL